MTVQAAPTLTVAGLAVPPTNTGALVGIDTLSITWGRPSVLARSTPATAQLTVLDRSRGFTFARRTDLIGQPVVLGYAGDGGLAGTNFRGRITDADAQPGPDGGIQVALSCSSREVDAANYEADRGTVFPAETMYDRLARINAMLPAGFFAGGAVMPAEADGFALAAQQDVSGADALALLRQFYDSVSAAPMVYDPNLDRLAAAPLRMYGKRFTAGVAFSAGLVADPALGGRHIPRALFGLSMDADQWEYSGPLSQPIDTRITLVSVSFRNQDVAYAQRNVGALTDLFASEATDGRRSLSIDSIHAVTANAQALARSWAALATREGHAPRLEPIVYDSGRNGGFDSAAHAALLLAGGEARPEGGGEATSRFFVRGTWVTQLLARPLFGIIGATVRYAVGDWSIAVQPVPVVTEVPTQPLRVNYAGTPGIRLVDIDPSVTLGDLRFVDVGAGFTFATQPPWIGA